MFPEGDDSPEKIRHQGASSHGYMLWFLVIAARKSTSCTTSISFFVFHFHALKILFLKNCLAYTILNPDVYGNRNVPHVLLYMEPGANWL